MKEEQEQNQGDIEHLAHLEEDYAQRMAVYAVNNNIHSLLVLN